jgi:hypothetical protein
MGSSRPAICHSAMAICTSNVTLFYLSHNRFKGISKSGRIANIERLQVISPMIKLQDDWVRLPAINARMRLEIFEEKRADLITHFVVLGFSSGFI